MFHILVGEGDMEPFFPCLDLLLLMVCTWLSTRACPERSVVSEGNASDVSSAFPMVIADFSGSRTIIFLDECPRSKNVSKNVGLVKKTEEEGKVAVVTNAAVVPSMQMG